MRLLLQICSKPEKYAKAVKIQNMFNHTNSSNKFKIEGGVKNEYEEKFYEKFKEKGIEDIIKEYRLGEAGTYER